MRGVLALVAAAAVMGCAEDMTAPVVARPSYSLSPAPDTGAAMGPWRFGRHGGPGFMMARRLPANLRLTDAQRAQIGALMANFRAAHASELSAMRRSMQQMRAAHTAGRRLSPDEHRAFLQHTAPARERLITAERALAAQIQNVLTIEQKAWLAAHRPVPCANAAACGARFARRGMPGANQMRNPS